MVSRRELGKDEQEDPSVLNVIAMRDGSSKALAARAVPQKGVDPERFTVSCVVDFVLWLGHSRVILMTDNEGPIVSLVRESLKSLRVEGLEQVGEQHPVPYDPAGNGSAEVGVQLVKGRLATCKRSLELRLQCRIPPLLRLLLGLCRTLCSCTVFANDMTVTAGHRMLN